jgi:Sortase domain
MNKNYKIIKTVNIKHPKTYILSRMLWVYRYRLYTITSMFILIFLLFSSGLNVPTYISANGYKVVSKNLLFDEQVREDFENNRGIIYNVDKNSVVLSKDKDFNFTYLDLATALKNIGINSGNINIQTLKDIGGAVPIKERIQNLPIDRYIAETQASGFNLNDIYPAPESPKNRNFLRIPNYNINAPVIYASFEDVFGKNEKGEIDFTNVLDSSDVKSPLQVRLQSGVVHIPFTPFPGDVGNCYIVGHSSNFSFIKSDYNQVFKPIEKKGNAGEEFIIYDPYGRELKFRIFETLLIEEDQTDIAYKRFDDKRVCTLQTSVVTWRRNNGLYPYQRWLVRGELVQ